MDESYYKYHLFFCVNTRSDGGPCCGDSSAPQLRDYAKQRIGELGDAIPGNVRVNTAGCMNRCAEGPVLVIYPEAVWYRYQNRADIDEIITEHLCNGRPVSRLRI
ncbi:MAG TPA: (2Fe-2S) ferredoxin domain-containing protein [Gammaproteobacteria bacterium]|nr:(2Fe-2S) ferredoxin domain-containing protein [Gammaproteobacteria bacterium]